MKLPLVFSLGGSVVAPGALDERFIRRFCIMVRTIAKKRRVIVVCGGGVTSRTYIAAARTFGVRSLGSLHWVGIRATQLNAELMRAVLGVKEPILLDYGTQMHRTGRIVIAGGNVPGHTTDFGAITLARRFGAREVVNVTNVKGVYTADPRKDRTAKLLPALSWREYLAMFPATVTPGMHAPFDPVAGRLAAKYRMTVRVVAAKPDLLRFVILGTRAVGTIIRSS